MGEAVFNFSTEGNAQSMDFGSHCREWSKNPIHAFKAHSPSERKMVSSKHVPRSKFACTGMERNAFPFKNGSFLSRFFPFKFFLNGLLSALRHRMQSRHRRRVSFCAEVKHGFTHLVCCRAPRSFNFLNKLIYGIFALTEISRIVCLIHGGIERILSPTA